MGPFQLNIFYGSNFEAQKADSNQSGVEPARYSHPEFDWLKGEEMGTEMQ